TVANPVRFSGSASRLERLHHRRDRQGAELGDRFGGGEPPPPTPGGGFGRRARKKGRHAWAASVPDPSGRPGRRWSRGRPAGAEVPAVDGPGASPRVGNPVDRGDQAKYEGATPKHSASRTRILGLICRLPLRMSERDVTGTAVRRASSAWVRACSSIRWRSRS